MTASRTVFETERLRVRMASENNADVLHALWTNPRVMRNVGFPEGLPVTRESIVAQIGKRPATEYDQFLIVVRREDGARLGECKLHRPDENGIAGTDVKLDPEFWGRRYGVEVKQGLVDYLFQHTDCTAVEAGPNVRNVASIRMQESVGGVRVDEKVYEFPSDTPGETEDVHHYVYRLFRDVWEKCREQ